MDSFLINQEKPRSSAGMNSLFMRLELVFIGVPRVIQNCFLCSLIEAILTPTRMNHLIGVEGCRLGTGNAVAGRVALAAEPFASGVGGTSIFGASRHKEASSR